MASASTASREGAGAANAGGQHRPDHNKTNAAAAHVNPPRRAFGDEDFIRFSQFKSAKSLLNL